MFPVPETGCLMHVVGPNSWRFSLLPRRDPASDMPGGILTFFLDVFVIRKSNTLPSFR